MRLRAHAFASILSLALVALAPSAATSQAGPGGRRLSNTYFGGDNLRVVAGRATPHAGMHYWEPGLLLGIAWESWDPGRGGGSTRLAVGVSGTYSSLPFSRNAFVADFQSTTGQQVTEATASDAVIADLLVTMRVRGPTMFVMPSLLIGVGYYNFKPSTIVFRATDSTGTARSRGKNGPAVNIGLGIDGPFVGRTALFADAVYAYGWSSDNLLSQSATSRCGGNLCDTFRSTQTTMLRGGIRFRLGRF